MSPDSEPSGPGPVVVNGSSAAYTSAAVGRADGSFNSIENTSASNSGGTSARRTRAGGATLLRCCERSDISAVSMNGTSPVSSSNSTQPRE